MDKNFALFAVVIASIILLIYTIFFTPLFIRFNGEEDEEDIEDWNEYPYEIPDTDIRFPDEEGRYPKEPKYIAGDTWISLGMRLNLEDPDLQEVWLVFLYHDTYKDVFLSTPEETHTRRIGEGEKTLPEGKMNMTFHNDDPSLPDDKLIADEENAFQYDFKSFFQIDGKNYEIDLDIEAEKPPATMTDYDGEVDFGENYYRIHSLTHCPINGSFTIDGETHETDGISWIENQRGKSFSFPEMQWDWFALWGERDNEFKGVDVANLYGQRKQYGMYVHPDGEIDTIDDLNIEVTSLEEEFGYSWVLTSDQYPISLNITADEDKMIYGDFGVGLGEANGELMGQILDDVQVYLELTQLHQ